MKRILTLTLVIAFLASLSVEAQAPTRFYRVRAIGGSNDTILAGGFALEFRDVPSRNIIVNAFTDAYGYTDTIPDPDNPGQTIPNPVTRAAFTARQLELYIRSVVRQKLTQNDADAAKAAKEAELDADLPE